MKKFDLKKTVAKARSLDYKKLARDFVYGKPAGERRLGDLYMDKTGLYKHREWRGIKDTFYYFNKVWLYNYGMMVYDVMRYGGVVTFAKGCWRYRWMGQTICRCCTGSTAAWRASGARRCGPARGTIGAWSTPPSSSSCRCSATT